MQAKLSHIYNKCENQELSESIGNLVFKSIADNMRNPPDLIMRVKYLGNFIVRSSKIDVYANKLPPDGKWNYEDEEANIFRDEEDREQFKKDRKDVAMCKRMMERYEVYREKKKESRRIRDEFAKSSV